MTCRSGVVAIGIMLLLCSAWDAGSQEPSNGQRAAVREIAFSVQVSADGKPALPDNSKIEWKGTGEGCTDENGTQSLHTSGATRLSLRACKMRLLIFITGYNTKQVLADLSDPDRRQGDSMNIVVKQDGNPAVTWRAAPSAAHADTPLAENDDK
jgi:hypothetical protein